MTMLLVLIPAALFLGLIGLVGLTSIVGVLWYGASEVLAASMSAGRLGQFVLFAAA